MLCDLNLFLKLVAPESRREGARDLAKLFGADDVLFFDWDREVSRFLPSLGFPQTIRDGKSWNAFLSRCSENGTATADLQFAQSNAPHSVYGKRFGDLVLAFSNGSAQAIDSSDELSLIAGHLLRILQNERFIKGTESQTTTMQEFTNDLRTYADALNVAKSDLRAALQDAQAARDVAEKANATKSAFLANMSHEIRTPLGAILGFSTLLKDNHLSTEERDRFIETINRNGQLLTRIIDDILDLAKVEAGKIDIEQISFSLFGLIDEVIGLFKERTKQKGIFLLLTVDDDVPATIMSDPTRLRQILINIIGNAVKFTEVGGVRVNVRCQNDGSSLLRILVDVKDTGAGFSDEQKTRLFQPFVQADNTTTRKYGGTGLGLVLAKRLSEALGGTVTVSESTLGKGSTFVISFLAMASNHAQPYQPIEAQRNQIQNNLQPLKGIRILLVDDSPDNQQLITQVLAKSGAEVEVADNGQNAIKSALNQSFNVILMDIQMPVMDGYQAKAELNKHQIETPVIALTAHAMLEERQKTRNAGFAGHLTKPLEFTELIETIAHFGKPKSR